MKNHGHGLEIDMVQQRRREKTFLLQPTNGATIGESGGEGFSNGPINQQVLPPHDHDHDDHGDDDNQVL